VGCRVVDHHLAFAHGGTTLCAEDDLVSVIVSGELATQVVLTANLGLSSVPQVAPFRKNLVEELVSLLVSQTVAAFISDVHTHQSCSNSCNCQISYFLL